MKDIDFDELDRAVNSLMSGVPKAEPAREDGVKTLALDPVVSSGEDVPEQLEANVTVDSHEITGETGQADEDSMSVPSAPPAVARAARRRGQFMDMVRPSAPEARKPVPVRPISRNGATIHPAGSSRPVVSSIDGISQSPLQASEQVDSPQLSEWPDPLEAVDFNTTTEAVMVKADRTEMLTTRASSLETDSEPQESSPPLTSPFLPDTKVEKRPLGRMSDSDTFLQGSAEPDHTSVPESGSSVSDQTDGKSGDVASPQQPLPVELGRDVMAIEADTSNTSEESPEPSLDAKTMPVRSSALSLPPNMARPVATSIPQQYKVHPKVAEPSSGAIYDTAAYHQPLSHPAKKKPGWVWVMAIILILLLGAGSGAAVYFLGLV